MRILRTHGARALAAAGLIGGAMLLPTVASSAAVSPATPGNCSMSVSGQDMSAQCLTGTGQYRIYGWCVKDDDPSQHYAQYGNWVSPPHVSTTGCTQDTFPDPQSIQKR